MTTLTRRTGLRARRLLGSARRRGAETTTHAREATRSRWKDLRRTYKVEVNAVAARPLSPDGAPVPGEFRLQPADEDSIARMRELYPKELNDRKVGILNDRVRGTAEDAWVVLDQEGNLCGYACLAWQDHEMKLMRHVVKVHPHQALFMDDYVFKKHRRRGVHKATVAVRVGLAAQRGRTEGLVLVDVTNRASTATYRGQGFTTIGRLVHVRGIRRTVEVRRPRRRPSA